MESSRVRRRWSVATVLVVAAMLAPVVLDRDGFPLSNYPMYSRARPREVALVTAVGVDTQGNRQRLSLPLIGVSDDPLIVAGELRSTIIDGRAPQRCAQIASRVAAAPVALNEYHRLAFVEVVTERLDTVDQVMGEPSELDRTVHARCKIGSAR